MQATRPLFYLLLLICALNTTHNAVFNQCILYIHEELASSQYQLKLTLSVYFCAIFFIRCFIGTIADNCSEKKCILTTLFIAIFGHIMACSATNIHLLIVARFIQGLGLGGGQVMGLVILMKLFSSKGRSSIIAAEQVLFSIASITLPFMGNIFSSYISWRLTYLVYILTTLYAISYFFFSQKETKKTINKLRITHEISSPKALFNLKFLTPTLMACFSISGYILWGSYFSILVHHYQIDWRYLLFYQLVPIIPYFTCSLLFKKLTSHLNKHQIYKRIFCFQTLALTFILALLAWDKTTLSFKIALLCPIIIHNIAGAFFRPLMQEKALSVIPSSKIGAASSFISISQVGVNAIFAIIINYANNFIVIFTGIQIFINIAIIAFILITQSYKKA